jgi:hypothetical protein
MSNIRHKTIAAAPSSKIAATIFSILLIALLASPSGLNAPAFSQEESNNDEDGGSGTLVLSGRINSILMPTMADTNNDPAMNNSAIMPQTINNNSTAAANDTTTTAASQAMRFSMARDIAWLLSGDWVLAADANDSNTTTTFDAEFIKVTTNGTMLHTHRITNFVPLTNVSDLAAGFDSNTNATTIMGKADVYFNDELVWPQADTTLSIMNGTILIIDIDSQDVDDHFHNQPIFGTVSTLSKDDGFSITLPTPRSIQEKFEQELAELGANVTQAESAIETEVTQAGRTFAEEAMGVFNNITNSIRQYLE